MLNPSTRLHKSGVRHGIGAATTDGRQHSPLPAEPRPDGEGAAHHHEHDDPDNRAGDQQGHRAEDHGGYGGEQTGDHAWLSSPVSWPFP